MSWIFGTFVNRGQSTNVEKYLQYGEEGEAELTALYCDIGEVKEVDLKK